ncbi:DUF4391 domain-containing protein [Desulforamulus ferrireducens]|uniref:DUF4391 domain-containing protein n=1 Tax=Desulforamulus ferrireducens TaxID=1833852 RepID=A0A1S6IY77_9FIRM|nr:DUF4391 domain-containing protein [Desulforamulus ferrireducens]AQS59711.1 hypothetical protein B0537_11855 [Desulforamulus ferrireducens]
MDDYRFLNIPDSCFVGSTIYKKLFYENAHLSSSDKSLFTDTINKVVWLYCLKPETINIPAYKDEVREYPEIEVIEVILNKEYGLNRIAEIIMRTIPYPMLLIFKLEDKIRFYMAHQRTSQSDSSKNTIEEFISTDWLRNDSDLFAKLDIKQMRFTNFYTLYSDIVDAISIYNLSAIMPTDDTITGAEARELSVKIEDIEQRIANLRSKLKKESQFNRKMELNIEIKRLEQSKNKLLGGDNE